MRSLVGIIPLFAVEVLEQDVIEKLPGFRKRMRWFLAQSPRSRELHYLHGQRIARRRAAHAAVARDSVARAAGARAALHARRKRISLAVRHPFALAVYREHPYALQIDGTNIASHYEPAESHSGLFGGNSNWRGPIWFPVNYLLIEALERYHHFYGDD